jgi:hypothetical protein
MGAGCLNKYYINRIIFIHNFQKKIADTKMGKNAKTLDCFEYIERKARGRRSAKVETGGIDQYSLEREMNSNISRDLRLNGLARLLATTAIVTGLAFGACALPISSAEAGLAGFVKYPERNINLNIKVSSKPEEADVYYAPMEKEGVLPDKEKYVHAGKTPLKLELLIHSPEGSRKHWEPFSYHIVGKKEGYRDIEAFFGSAGITFARPSPDGKNYLLYGQWYNQKDKEKLYLKNPNLTKFDVNYDLVFELIKEETKEKIEEKN